jgi:hypothetical protein
VCGPGGKRSLRIPEELTIQAIFMLIGLGEQRSCVGLSGHTRVKSQLVTPINSYDRLHLLDWYRDLPPEHLWIDLLRQQVGEDRYLIKFNQLLDRLQAANGAEPVFHGHISEFGLFPEEQRADFLQAHGDLVREAFFPPAGRLLMGYPNG